ncbi:hypothetical protein CATYP_07275 [Corynebacterium atypicum]|uniref:Uncharacterized protein n=2 Tax=Corynebacterium atypicum TaxID=191610 RepID=A0ABM5QNK3_9CORY|nr:hypothetical protein CATYP_07275 [Corynebacterium atypicum]
MASTPLTNGVGRQLFYAMTLITIGLALCAFVLLVLTVTTGHPLSIVGLFLTLAAATIAWIIDLRRTRRRRRKLH